MSEQNREKRFISILLSGMLCLSLAACGNSDAPLEPTTSPADNPVTEDTLALETPPTQEVFTFSRESFPRLDGSTSTAPLAEAVCSVLLGESREDVTDLVQFSKTTNAYYNLLDGQADLLIVGEPNEDVLAEKESRGFQWLQTPFATDAFVFLVNEDNPVDSITVVQA